MWLPQVVKGLTGTNDAIVGWITALPYLMMAVGMVVNGIHSDRTGERVRHVAFPALWGTVWLLISRVVPSPIAALVCVIVAALGTSAMLGPFWVLPSAMLSGTAAAAGIALINSVGNLGGFAGPYLGGLVEDWTKSSSNSLYVVAAGYLMVGVLAMLVRVPRTKPGAGQNAEAEVV
jgi:ACS family tartrate transporter-like MFS transporter